MNPIKIDPDIESAQNNICPVTFLPVKTRPEWTDINIAENYSVSFRLIGKAIFCTAPNGILSKAGINKLFVEREKFLVEADLQGKKYVEIVDQSLLAGYPSKEIRMMMTNFLVREFDTGNLLGFWVFNTSTVLKLVFTVAIKIYKRLAHLNIVSDYKKAIENAVNVLDQNGIDVGIRQYKKFTKDDWSIELDNYGIRFELIGNDVLYSVAHGSLKESYVKIFFLNYIKRSLMKPD